MNDIDPVQRAKREVAREEAQDQAAAAKRDKAQASISAPIDDESERELVRRDWQAERNDERRAEQ